MRKISVVEASTSKQYPDYRDMKLVKEALHDSDFDFRTPRGIASETGVALHLVRRALNNKFLARNTCLATPENQMTYVPAGRPPTLREETEKIRWM